MKSISQKTVLVTGANRGIGLEVCRQLGKLGYHIFLSARNSDKGSNAVAKLKRKNVNAEFIQMDVADENSVKNAANEFGKKSMKLDVLINNAAILKDTEITKMTTKELVDVLNINAVGTFVVTREFLPFMDNGSRIINVSSGAGALTDMESYAPAYSISKTALNAITKQFAATFKHRDIAVNSVTPGWVRTDMGGMSASRSVEKGAETIVWLATEVPIDKTGLFWRDKKVINW
jgi:NAD(P)-dependent dehydrogenase (short-subunit alcohol dehydrogenase family)